MTALEDENLNDVTGWENKLANLRLPFDREDVPFWFQQFEMHHTTAGVKKQWTKHLQLHKLIPEEVIAEVKDLLRRTVADAGSTPYKTLKDRILKKFDKE